MASDSTADTGVGSDLSSSISHGSGGVNEAAAARRAQALAQARTQLENFYAGRGYLGEQAQLLTQYSMQSIGNSITSNGAVNDLAATLADEGIAVGPAAEELASDALSSLAEAVLEVLFA